MNLINKQNYYEILGVNRDATKKEIKSKYLELAKTFHPDVNKSSDSESKFQKISEAYQTLKDDKLRQKYDDYLSKIEDKLKETKKKKYDFKNEVPSYQNLNRDLIYADPEMMYNLYNCEFSKEEFKIFLSFYDTQNILYLYRKFWESLWIDTSHSITIISYQNASLMFEVFSELLKNKLQINLNPEHVNIYETSLNEVIADVSKKIKSGISKNELSNYILPSINDVHLFDQENMDLIALLYKHKTLDFFILIEYIYKKNIDVTLTENEIIINPKQKKSKKWFFISPFIGVVLLIIIVSAFVSNR